MSLALSESLQHGLAALELELPADAATRLLQYLNLIARWNRVYNLTAVRDPQDMLSQHLLDCLAIVPPLRGFIAQHGPEPGQDNMPTLRVLDVGSGAGLPGVVLSIVEPSWSVTCVDTVAKKASFIRQVAAELSLPHLTATHQRVEAMDTGSRFNLVTCRAFASLADFINLTRDRLAPGGHWLAMKARLSADERAEVPADVEVFHVEQLDVPQLAAERCLVWMRPRAA